MSVRGPAGKGQEAQESVGMFGLTTEQLSPGFPPPLPPHPPASIQDTRSKQNHGQEPSELFR